MRGKLSTKMFDKIGPTEGYHDNQPNNTQPNNSTHSTTIKNVALSITTLDADCCYANYRLSRVLRISPLC